MSSNIQLVTMFFSFIYGIVFYGLTYINFTIIKNTNKYLKSTISFLFVLNMIVIYSIIIYRLNNGYFHIYFLCLVILSYILSVIIHSKMLVNRQNIH